jgi:hypothetical protein
MDRESKQHMEQKEISLDAMVRMPRSQGKRRDEEY